MAENDNVDNESHDNDSPAAGDGGKTGKGAKSVKASQTRGAAAGNKFRLLKALTCPEGQLAVGDEISLDAERATSLRNDGFID